ncbi:hypothetical protein SeLEV6574_g08403 [Synchytrium endobioticum]|uniref:Integrase zinc-binding domain-containing protein n=1 Tax=Synchytrium endobioticum TaxID=286115 RepID=A0A507BWE3_9FUNG|nr:hypothetical protein SeLEV6574_g08403 [Synchytrium endobioticum]
MTEKDVKLRLEHQVIPTEAFPTEEALDALIQELKLAAIKEEQMLLDSTASIGNWGGSNFPLSVSNDCQTREKNGTVSRAKIKTSDCSSSVVEDDDDQKEEGNQGAEEMIVKGREAYHINLTGNEHRQQDVLKLYHDHPLAGHYGIQKTTELILRKYWWTGIRKSVMEHVKSCDTCQRNKTVN